VHGDAIIWTQWPQAAGGLLPLTPGLAEPARTSRGEAADAGAGITGADLTTAEVPAMASATVPPGGSSGNLSGIVDLEIDQIDIKPDYALNAVAVEIVNPAGDGVRCWLDIPMACDVALRIAVAIARLRRIVGTVP
jgi:hypothetical protein